MIDSFNNSPKNSVYFSGVKIKNFEKLQKMTKINVPIRQENQSMFGTHRIFKLLQQSHNRT